MNLIQKAVSYLIPTNRENVPNESRGVLSTYVPNVGSWGQPNTANGPIADIYGSITPQRMREIILKTPTASAAINAILDFATGVKIAARNTDPAQKPPFHATQYVLDLLKRPNPQDTQRKLTRKVLRDLEVLGYSLVEIERNRTGGVANLWVLDPGLIRIDFDKHGSIKGFNQIDNVSGIPIVTPVSQGGDGIHTWTPDDVLYFSLDAISESMYPQSRVAMLFALAVVEALMVAFIGGRFTDSNIPFGVMDLGDITEDELKAAIGIWNQQVESTDHPEHRILFTGSKGSGAKWLPFGYNLSELEAPEILSRVRLMILGILGVTVQEIGEADDVNKSNGYNLSFTFKKRAIEPLLDEFIETVTRFLVHQALGFRDLELYYEDIDSRDELLQSQIDDLRLKAGIVSINQVRNRDGDENTPGGDEPTVSLGNSVIPVSMLKDFAAVQLEALQMINLQTKVGIMQALQAMQQPQVDPATGEVKPPAPLPPLASLPLVRGMQPPEKFTTIDGSGSSTTKFKEPKPAMKPGGQTGAPNPAAPRGPTETAQRAGVRKDNLK